MTRAHGDGGESLVEILAAMTILSIGITGLVTALGTNASTTVVNRSQSQASTTLLAAAEYVKGLPFLSSCGPSTAVTVPTSALPRANGVSATYGPGRQLGTTACGVLDVIPVRVTGDGFTLTVDVVKRS